MTEKKYIITEADRLLLVDFVEAFMGVEPPCAALTIIRSLKPVEPVAIAEGRDLYWISNKKPADDEKDMFLFPLEN